MSRKHKTKLQDPALVYFLKYLRSLPEDQRRGLNDWCRENGILTPEMQRAIEHWETTFTDLERDTE